MQRRAARRSAGGSRAAAPSARRIAWRAGARGDPGRARSVRDRGRAVRGGRGASARRIGFGGRPDDESRRRVVAGAMRDRLGRPLGRGRRRRTGIARRGASAARPRALARARVRAVAGHATRPRASAPASTRTWSASVNKRAVTRLRGGGEDPCRPGAAQRRRAGCGRSRGSAGGVRRRPPTICGERPRGCWRCRRCGSGSSTTWPFACSMSRWSAPAARVTRRVRASSTDSAPRSHWRRVSLNDAQVEAETGLLLVGERHFVALALLAVAMIVQIERGALEAAAELSRRGEALGIAEDRDLRRRRT